MQENIAEEMIRMAQSLKHTSLMAGNIIKEDSKVGFLWMQLGEKSMQFSLLLQVP